MLFENQFCDFCELEGSKQSKAKIQVCSILFDDKIECFTSETLQNNPSESKSRKIEYFKHFRAKSVRFSKRFEG